MGPDMNKELWSVSYINRAGKVNGAYESLSIVNATSGWL